MNKNLLLSMIFICCAQTTFSQANCSNPIQVDLCPSTYLTNQTNTGMLDDAPAGCNYTGEDLVYDIYAPNGAVVIYVSIVNATSSMRLTMQQGTCGGSSCVLRNVLAGSSNTSFNVSPASHYYLWVDAPVSTTFNISIGGDTSISYVSIPDTQGNLQFDNTCASPPFANNKKFLQVTYNGSGQTNPMTLAPLWAQGQLCVKVFFKNTTGVEGIKKIDFFIDPFGFLNPTAPNTIPGFYNSGNWVKSTNLPFITYTFFDSAGIGRGDFTGTPNSCLGYEFCFDLTPTSNDPQFTNVTGQIFTDGFGIGYSGWVYSGCCPAPHVNCHGSGGGGGNGTNGFGFGFADPGGSLPIELLSFQANVSQKKVKLNWTTVSEINNDYFTVERSRNTSDWIMTNRIKGAGNSTTYIDYSAEDTPQESGIYYYRLKQTDFDGNFSYSSIEVVDVMMQDNILVFPNPASKYFVVQSGEMMSLSFSLRNIIGEKINIPVNYQNDGTIFDTSLLPEGLYLLSIEKNHRIVKMEKIIVSN